MGLPLESPFGVTQIHGNLWQGGKPEVSADMAAPIFDVVVLCADEIQKPEWGQGLPRFLIVRAPLDDCDPIRQGDQVVAIRAAEIVIDQLRAGKKVLVTCHQGRNRSGWVTAMALVGYYKMPVDKAVKLIQSKRFWALSNRAFVRFLLSIGPRR